MAEELILVERTENICTLSLNRPERRNALFPPLLLRLAEVMDSLKGDDGVRVVVIRGVGEEAFSSGYDITQIESRATTAKGEDPLQVGLEAISNYPRPVIAMIYGFAVGAGCELAATCDLRVAADTARLGITPAKLGVVYHYSGIRRFINLIGAAQTKELFFTGRLIDAQRAREIGLVNQVVPASDLPSATYSLAREIAENAPLSVSATKTMVSRLLKHQQLSAEEGKDLMALRTHAWKSQDFKEGQRAFAEKRKPHFRGR